MQSLKILLISRPDIQTVYLNEAGEWVFFPRAGFETSFSREEILDLADGDELGNASTSEELENEKAEFETQKTEFENEKAEFQIGKAKYSEIEASLAEAKQSAEEAITKLKTAEADLAKSKTEVKSLTEKLKAAEAASKVKNNVDDITG